MSTCTELTEEHIDAMDKIRDGADIKSIILAKQLREVEKIAPEFITIVPPMGHYHVRESLPYFGAILTPEGVAFVDEKLGKKKS